MNTLQRLLISSLRASLWPAYMALLSIVARIGPWPRGIGRPAGFIFAVLAMAMFATSLLRSLFRTEGWICRAFDVPGPVLGQLRRAKYALTAVAIALLIPEELLARGLITSSGRPIVATTICHLLIIAFEVMVFIGVARLLRQRGPVGEWLTTSPDQLGWVGRHRRGVRLFLLAVLGSMIGLETQGYGFTARRFALAGIQSIVILGFAWVAHRLAVTLIAKYSWRWIRRGASSASGTRADALDQAAELPGRVRRLVDWGVPLLAGLLGIWIWDVDLALFNYLGSQPLWTFVPEVKNQAGDVIPAVAITVANVVTSIVIFVLTAGTWRYLSMLAALSCLHLGLDKIGVVLAALGVGLGFGLQEIVSNFVSGIILLLERPIRVGDIVTVAAMTGKIDRINIRATTVINAENQCLIIPNREFITGNLINWTHKDKIIRFSIRVNVALGTDPDQVSELLLAIAKADSDVLGNPIPSAYLDAFGASHLDFILHVYVPDPSYPGKVRHRLCTQIQKRFAEAGIVIPLPLQQLRFDTGIVEATRDGVIVQGVRLDPAEATPPPPRIAAPTRGLASRARLGFVFVEDFAEPTEHSTRRRGRFRDPDAGFLDRDIVQEEREGERPAVGRVDRAGESLAGDHALSADGIINPIGPRLGSGMPSGRAIAADRLGKRTVFTQDGHRRLVARIIGTLGHRAKESDRRARRHKIFSRTARSATEGDRGEIDPEPLEDLSLSSESLGQIRLAVIRRDQERKGARVEVMADLEDHLDVFAEGRRRIAREPRQRGDLGTSGQPFRLVPTQR
jgi:potassium efflux system protein